MNETLTIKNVDLKDLEQQRLLLISIIMDDVILSTMTADQQYALQGIIAMLDSWADGVYHNGVRSVSIDTSLVQSLTKRIEAYPVELKWRNR